jgi:hypothetical protein
VRYSPGVDGEHLPARRLDAPDHNRLDREAAEEPVEVGGDDDLGPSRLDRLHRGSEPGPVVKVRAAGYVQLLKDLDQVEPLALALRFDAVTLRGRRGEAVALAASHLRDADEPQRASFPHRCLWYRARPGG